MLKIVQSDTASEQRWTLCGQLAGPWVTELRLYWERSGPEVVGRKRVIDLRDVTFIDENGAGLLHQMRDEGGEFLATGVDTRDVLENLTASGQRPLRKSIAPVPECDQPTDGRKRGRT